MKKVFDKKRYFLIILSIYLLFQLILYILLHTTSSLNYTYGCYSVIVCGLIVSSLIYVIYHKKYIYLIVIAQGFTLISDTFLVLMDDYYNIALISFIFVQIFYYLYIMSLHKFKYNLPRKIFLIIRLAIIPIMIIVTIIIKDLTIFLASIYFVNLFLNFIESCMSFKFNKLLPFGLLLFIFCDIFVGINNIADFINISTNSFIYKIIVSDVDFMWLFYHPSQVLLSISGLFQTND